MTKTSHQVFQEALAAFGESRKDLEQNPFLPVEIARDLWIANELALAKAVDDWFD